MPSNQLTTNLTELSFAEFLREKLVGDEVLSKAITKDYEGLFQFASDYKKHDSPLHFLESNDVNSAGTHVLSCGRQNAHFRLHVDNNLYVNLNKFRYTKLYIEKKLPTSNGLGLLRRAKEAEDGNEEKQSLQTLNSNSCEIGVIYFDKTTNYLSIYFNHSDPYIISQIALNVSVNSDFPIKKLIIYGLINTEVMLEQLPKKIDMDISLVKEGCSSSNSGGLCGTRVVFSRSIFSLNKVEVLAQDITFNKGSQIFADNALFFAWSCLNVHRQADLSGIDNATFLSSITTTKMKQPKPEWVMATNAWVEYTNRIAQSHKQNSVSDRLPEMSSGRCSMIITVVSSAVVLGLFGLVIYFGVKLSKKQSKTNVLLFSIVAGVFMAIAMVSACIAVIRNCGRLTDTHEQGRTDSLGNSCHDYNEMVGSGLSIYQRSDSAETPSTNPLVLNVDVALFVNREVDDKASDSTIRDSVNGNEFAAIV
jgi:hypothetical protein